MKSLIKNFQTMTFDQLVDVNGGYGGGSSSKHYDTSHGGYSSATSGLNAHRYVHARQRAAVIAAKQAAKSPVTSTKSGGNDIGYDSLTSGLDAERYATARANAAKTQGAFVRAFSDVNASSINSSGVAQWNQRNFSAQYGDLFGDHACAATSLLNEISEIYTSVTGKTLTANQAAGAMYAAVMYDAIDSKEAFVNSWEKAANIMASSVGLKGTFTYTTDVSKATSVIYCECKGTNSYHFVNTVGSDNKMIYDPYSGKNKTLSEIKKESDSISTRCLIYKSN